MTHKKTPLRQAFILTIAATTPACWIGVTNNPPEPGSCPAEQPAAGSDCSQNGSACNYVDECGHDVEVTCEDFAWQVSTSASCNPPPPVCPDEPPAAGEFCDAIGNLCTYHVGDFCDERVVEATCTATGWEVEEYWESTCNPPPAECPAAAPIAGSECEYQPDTIDGYPSYCPYTAQTPCGEAIVEGRCEPNEESIIVWNVTVPACTATPEQCQIYDLDIACAADAGCAWRAPGCETEGAPLVEAGCYPSLDCTVEGCGTWGSCETVTYNPCYNSDCDACAAETSVCVPVVF
jgi:hypothetical protein